MTRIPKPAAQVLGFFWNMDILMPTLALEFDAARTFIATANDLSSQIMIRVMDNQNLGLIDRLKDTIIPQLENLRTELEELENWIESEPRLAQDIREYGWTGASITNPHRLELRNSIVQIINDFYFATQELITSTGGRLPVRRGSVLS